MIDGLIKLFFKDGASKPINLGNPEPVSIMQLASEVIKLTGTRSEIERKALPSDDPKQREPNIAKAKTLLEWAPSTKREVGLVKTIEYFRIVLD